jgi:hypothetical protein
VGLAQCWRRSYCSTRVKAKKSKIYLGKIVILAIQRKVGVVVVVPHPLAILILYLVAQGLLPSFRHLILSLLLGLYYDLYSLRIKIFFQF